MNGFKEQFVGFFRAVSQSFFFDDAWFGASFLVLLLIFDLKLFISAALGALIGHVYTFRYSTPRILRASGLIQVNGLFFGVAMASLFEASLSYYLCLALGALVMPLMTKAVFEVLQHWKLSAFIVPYVFTVWAIWLCSQNAELGLQALPPLEGRFADTIHPMFNSVFESIGRLLFLPSPVFGVFVAALVFVFSPRRGAFFLLGTVIASVISFLFTGGAASWEHGVYSFSAGLVGLGLASFPEKFSFSTIAIFCVASSFFTMACSQFLGRLNLPVLSVPYVLTLWLAILSRVPRLDISWAPSKTFRAPSLQPVAASVDEDGDSKKAA